MISTSPSSLAASWAPLLAASKKPLPSDLTTSAILTLSAWAAPANMAAVNAAVTSNFLNMLIEFPPLSVALHRRCGAPLPSRLQRRFLGRSRRAFRHDQHHSCVFQ